MNKWILRTLVCTMFLAGLAACGGKSGGGGGIPVAETPTYSISGTVTNNSGDETHYILIGACTDAAMTNCPGGRRRPAGPSASYTISGLPAGTYYLGACVDSDNSQNCNVPPDPGAQYGAPDPVSVSNANVKGIDITIP